MTDNLDENDFSLRGVCFQIGVVNSTYEMYCTGQCIHTFKKEFFSFPWPRKSQCPQSGLPYPHCHGVPLPRPLSVSSFLPSSSFSLFKGRTVLQVWSPDQQQHHLGTREKASSLAPPQAGSGTWAGAHTAVF